MGTAALQLMGRRRLSCWLLLLFPTILCVAALADLARGSARIGLAAFESDEKQLAILLCFLAVSGIAAFRPGWRWLFWAAWVLNALVCGVLIYLAFFWKVFS